MLNVMRESFQNSTWARWLKTGLLLAVAVSMIAYLGAYFGDDGGAAGGPWIAKVDGQSIPISEYQQVGRNLEQRYQQMFGEQYEKIREQLDVERAALEQVISRKVMAAEAEAAGLEVSEAEVAQAIVESPQMKDPATGAFIGKDRYLDAMRRSYPGGPEAFEQALAQDLLIEKWRRLVTEAAFVADADLEKAWRQRNERARIDYAVVPSAGQSFPTAVSDADAEAWYRGHQDAYRRPEARRIRYVVVDRQAQAAKVPVSDAEIRAFHDANKAQFDVPEQRRASHVLIRVAREAGPAEVEAARARAQAVLDRARKGEDFATLARSLTEDEPGRPNGGDLGWFGKGDMVPAFESTVWRTEPGQIGDLTRSEFGWHVIKVTGKRDAGQRPFEEVKEDIRRQLTVRAAQQRVTAEADRIAASIGGEAGKLDEVAKKEGLTVAEKTVAGGEMLPDLGPSPEFTQEVFSAKPGTVTRPLGVAQGLAIVSVGEVVPPSVRPLAEVRERVVTDVLNERARRAAVATARAALTQAGGLDGAAKALKVSKQPTADLTVGAALPGTGGSSDSLAKAILRAGTKAGDTGVVEVPAGAVIYQVASYQPFDPAAFQAQKETLRAELREQKRTALLEAILRRLQEKHEIEINEAMLPQRS
jgi:peptidyl-prolyl cis-trans isomerase D